MRIKRKISQTILGAHVNLTQQAVAKWEKGIAEPDSETLACLADFFNVTTDYLLGKSNVPNPHHLNIPDILSDKLVAFDRAEFEDLDQSEVDSLAVIAEQLKKQRRL
jgi:transcriptional regulator with XRE-family HTH domain